MKAQYDNLPAATREEYDRRAAVKNELRTISGSTAAAERYTRHVERVNAKYSVEGFKAKHVGAGPLLQNRLSEAREEFLALRAEEEAAEWSAVQ